MGGRPIEQVCYEDVDLEEQRHVARRLWCAFANGCREFWPILTAELDGDSEDGPHVPRKPV